MTEADGETAVEFDPSREQFPGIILGISTCSSRFRNAQNQVEITITADRGTTFA